MRIVVPNMGGGGVGGWNLHKSFQAKSEGLQENTFLPQNIVFFF